MPHTPPGEPFRGFAPPTSNTTYVPNQFFDVCRPHCSRGAVRLVGYLVRKTLGWSDAHGRPQAARHVVRLQRVGGAGRDQPGPIRSAIDEAIRGHFILCVREPRPKAAEQPAVTGLYELKWDERGEYVKDPTRFRGFFAGEGNPDVRAQRILRHPAAARAAGRAQGGRVGAAGLDRVPDQVGHRRQHVARSYQHIQNYSKLKDRKTLSAALQHGLSANYLERVEEGYFDRAGGSGAKRLSMP